MAPRSTGSGRSSRLDALLAPEGVARHLGHEVAHRRGAASSRAGRASTAPSMSPASSSASSLLAEGQDLRRPLLVRRDRGWSRPAAPAPLTRSGALVASCSATQPPNEAPTRVARRDALVVEHAQEVVGVRELARRQRRARRGRAGRGCAGAGRRGARPAGATCARRRRRRGRGRRAASGGCARASCLRGQLAAGRVDVAPARQPHGRARRRAPRARPGRRRSPRGSSPRTFGRRSGCRG